MLICVLALGSIAEAAGAKKSVRHRPRHSSRVSAGSAEPTGTSGTAKKPTTRKKKPAARSAKSKPAPATAKKRPPSTKPR
jgi:hypothetical protein